MAPTPKDQIKDFEQAFERVLERRNRTYSEKVSEEDIKEQTKLLREIKKWNETSKIQRDEFSKLYSKSQLKQKDDAERRQKERLADNKVGWGNLREVFHMGIDGVRKSIKEGISLNVLSGAKMGVQLTNAFGLFGKFDVSGLIKKFDDYKAFSKERTEKNREQKMIESMYNLFVKEGKNKDQISAMLKMNGVKDEKIREMMGQMTELYRVRLERSQVEGVKAGLGNRGKLIANLEPVMVGRPSDEADLRGDEPTAGFGYSKRKSRDNKPGKIQFKGEGEGGEGFDNAILKNTYTELLDQGKTLDAMLLAAETYNNMYSEFTKEQQEEWERGRGTKKPEEQTGGLFSSILGANLASMIGSSIAKWLGGLGLTAVGITGAIGLAIGASLMGIAKIWSEWLDRKKTPEELAKSRQETSRIGAISTAGELGMELPSEGGMTDEQTANMAEDEKKKRAKIKEKEKPTTDDMLKSIIKKKNTEQKKKKVVPVPTQVPSPSEGTPTSQQSTTNTFLVGQRGMAGDIPGSENYRFSRG